ncbi:hypothetical protein [Oceanobacillus luteolus]|uniref:OmpH family outer membrane protein n=1 Tax=Oceanobacillus luteolus TaxID=1274358 RepID=A0ABW4HU69_9BACI
MGKKKRSFYILLISVALFTGGLTITAADSSISGVLTTWFNNKTDESIEEIDRAIQEEQAEQTERLKAALVEKVTEVEIELQELIEEEKEKQVDMLRKYADEKLQQLPNLEIGTEDKAVLEKELERIYQAAIKEMEEVTIEYSSEAGGEE